MSVRPVPSIVVAPVRAIESARRFVVLIEPSRAVISSDRSPGRC
jgi:hypothetical protein